MINLRSQRARERERVEQIAIMTGLERSLRWRLVLEFRRIARLAEASYKFNGFVAYDALNVNHQSGLNKIIRPHLINVSNIFGKRFFDALGKGDNLNLTKKDSQQSVFEQAQFQWIGLHGAKRVTAITNTTIKQINTAILLGVDQGLGSTAIGKLIMQHTAAQVGRTRSHIIARTETHQAANVGTHMAADATGLELWKRWSAAQQSRTRPTHRAANGQVVKKEGSFNVGGVQMKHPNDINAPAREVVNCRCVLTFETQEPVN